MSDALCGVATGGGVAPRTLYSNDEETLLETKRPVMLNGIAAVGSRPDLLDRALVLQLPAIPDERRTSEAAITRAWEMARPHVFAGLLDAVSTAIRRLPEVRKRVGPLPRMADAALWAMSAAPALGFDEDEVLAALICARDEQARDVVSGDPLGASILTLAKPWEGTADELRVALGEIVGPTASLRRGWPASARAVSSALRRLAPGLRRAGVDVDLDRRSPDAKRRRLIVLTNRPNRPNRPDRNDRPASRVSGAAGSDTATVHQPAGESAHGGAVGDGLDGSDGVDGRLAIPLGQAVIDRVTAETIAAVEGSGETVGVNDLAPVES